VSRAKEQPATLPDLAREAGLTFPASARLIGVHREAGMDDAVMLKVEIAAGDLPAFTKTCPVPAEVFAPGRAGCWGRTSAPGIHTAPPTCVRARRSRPTTAL